MIVKSVIRNTKSSTNSPTLLNVHTHLFIHMIWPYSLRGGATRRYLYLLGVGFVTFSRSIWSFFGFYHFLQVLYFLRGPQLFVRPLRYTLFTRYVIQRGAIGCRLRVSGRVFPTASITQVTIYHIQGVQQSSNGLLPQGAMNIVPRCRITYPMVAVTGFRMVIRVGPIYHTIAVVLRPLFSRGYGGQASKQWLMMPGLRLLLFLFYRCPTTFLAVSYVYYVLHSVSTADMDYIQTQSEFYPSQ